MVFRVIRLSRLKPYTYTGLFHQSLQVVEEQLSFYLLYMASAGMYGTCNGYTQTCPSNPPCKQAGHYAEGPVMVSHSAGTTSLQLPNIDCRY